MRNMNYTRGWYEQLNILSVHSFNCIALVFLSAFNFFNLFTISHCWCLIYCTASTWTLPLSNLSKIRQLQLYQLTGCWMAASAIGPQSRAQLTSFSKSGHCRALIGKHTMQEFCTSMVCSFTFIVFICYKCLSLFICACIVQFFIFLATLCMSYFDFLVGVCNYSRLSLRCEFKSRCQCAKAFGRPSNSIVCLPLPLVLALSHWCLSLEHYGGMWSACWLVSWFESWLQVWLVAIATS